MAGLDTGAVRIGEFSRRVGVSAELLRAWERRYGLLQPERSAGGFRLYTADDAARVARMQRALDEGLSAAEAAASVVASRPPSQQILFDANARLITAIDAFDEAGVHAVLDEAIAAVGLETLLGDLILPVLSAVGGMWEGGTTNVAHEHFASHLIRGRLMALARLWGRGSGQLALLACAPGETHDISLLAFGLVLRSHGWRIIFLGADTPLETLTQVAVATEPDVTVVMSFDPELLTAQAVHLTQLAQPTRGARPDVGRLVIAGPGAEGALAAGLDLPALALDVIAAAGDVAGGLIPG